jgi:hypothetical protein
MTSARRVKAAEQHRTPKRKRVMCASEGGYVLECGVAPPLLDVLEEPRASL